MKRFSTRSSSETARDIGKLALVFIFLVGLTSGVFAQNGSAPRPLLDNTHAVKWWFAFKFNAANFPGCKPPQDQPRSCKFGGDVQEYSFGQQFVYASSDNPNLQKDDSCIGTELSDPLGATFNQIYNGKFYYVIWNDQFYDDPVISGCTKDCPSPWGHSKGMLAWNDDGEGLVLQVSTPSWPAAGSKKFPRKSDGNTLGCVEDDDVKVSQHFFSAAVNKSDVLSILSGLQNASVVTDPNNPQIVKNGGPDEIQQQVLLLGQKSNSTSLKRVQLSSGIGFISKPSKMHVPPWQMVSSVLGSVSLKTATWWARPKIYSTTEATEIACWDSTLQKPGPVEIAISGKWDNTSIGLKGGPNTNANHAKFGVSTDKSDFSIFGDMNQQGTLSGPNCGSSQNGRGGLFYVIKNEQLARSIKALLSGSVAGSDEN